MISGNTKAVVLLGAQRFDPTLGEAVKELRITGRIATITAGWQEREEDDGDLNEHLGKKSVNLRLHARAEEVFKNDAELHTAHRATQATLRHRQDFYRIRLEHALDAQHVIDNRAAPEEILRDEARASIHAVRELDAMHMEVCANERKALEAKMKTAERPAVAEQRGQLAEIIKDCEAVAIAGGHVASLLNRLRLFGIAELLKGKVVLAWCGGAMCISERVVLFHDSPPQGPGAAEVLDAGLGLVGGVVVLPQPELRLRHKDKERMQVMARRFAPAICLGMPAKSRVTWLKRGPTSPHDVYSFSDDGRRRPFVTDAGGVRS